MSSTNEPKDISQKNVLIYLKVVQTAKRDNKSIDEVLKKLPSSKQDAYHRGKIAYRKLETAKKKTFKKTRPTQTTWEKRAYEAVKKTAEREGSLDKAFEILPPKYQHAYHKVQEQILGKEKARETREAFFKAKKEEIQKEIEASKIKEKLLKKVDTAVGIARGVTSFVTFGASESAIEARECLEKGDYRGAALRSGETIVLSATAAITNAPGMCLKIVTGAGKLIAGGGKGVYIAVRAAGAKGALIKGGQYLKDSVIKIASGVKEIPGAAPKIFQGLKNTSISTLKSLGGGSKEIYDGVATSLKYMPTKGGVIQGLGTIGAVDLAGRSTYEAGKSYYGAATAKSAEERKEHIKRALAETGFTALGLWGLKGISNLAAFQARIINGKDLLIKETAFGKIPKAERLERISKISPPDGSLTQKAQASGLPQNAIDEISSIEKRLIDTDKTLGILRGQRACGDGALKIAASPDGASFPWIPKEAVFTSRAARAEEIAILPGKISEASQRIKVLERYDRFLNYKLRETALKNGLTSPPPEDILANSVLKNDLLADQNKIKKLTDGLNEIKNAPAEELNRKAREIYEQQLKEILNKKEGLANKLITGYASGQTRTQMTRNMALNTPLWKLERMEQAGVSVQFLNKGDDLLKTGFVMPPGRQNFTEMAAYNPAEKRIVIVNNKNIEKCAEHSVRFGKRAASCTREEIKTITLEKETNLASQINSEEAVIVENTGNISRQLVKTDYQPQNLTDKLKNKFYETFFPENWQETCSPEYAKFRELAILSSIAGSAKSFNLAKLLFDIVGLSGTGSSIAAALATQARGIFYGAGGIIGKKFSPQIDKKPGEYLAKGSGIKILGDGLELSMFATQALPPPLNVPASIAAYLSADTVHAIGDNMFWPALSGGIEPKQAVGFKTSAPIRAAAMAQSALSSVGGLAAGYTLKGVLDVLPPFAFPLTIAGLGAAEYFLVRRASQLADEVITQNRAENLITVYLKNKKIPRAGKADVEIKPEEIPDELKKTLADQLKKDIPVNPRAQITEMYSNTEELSGLIRIYRGENYLLNFKNNNINIVSRIGADEEARLKAMYQAEKLRRVLNSKVHQGNVKNYGENNALKIALKDTLKEANEEFPAFLKALEEAKWKIKNLALPPGNAIWKEQKINLQTATSVIKEREQKWLEKRKEIDGIGDNLGLGIDENIKDCVTALNVIGINTSESCEGHIERGLGAPWIEIMSPNLPEERFIGQKAIYEKTAKKYNLDLNKLLILEPDFPKIYFEANKEAFDECQKNGLTEKFTLWAEESKKLRKITEEVLIDFYKDRKVSDNVRIKIKNFGAYGFFRIYSGAEADYNRSLTETQKTELGKRLEEYRKEMNAFALFLKNKYLAEGENYINNIKLQILKSEKKQALEKFSNLETQQRAAELLEKNNNRGNEHNGRN